MSQASARETLIFTIARLLEGVRHVAVGASSPIPAAGAMLLRALAERRGGEAVRISILGSAEHNFFTQGAGELFDCAAQGRIDAFFLGGGQIDGAGNINLVGSGDYPNSDVRWPGSFGSAFLYYVVPRVILFREEHSPRVLVEKVDFISAPGTSPAGIYRVGGPYALLTGAALFAFEKDKGRFRLESVHPGHTVEEINASTGFAFAAAPSAVLAGGSALVPLADARARPATVRRARRLVLLGEGTMEALLSNRQSAASDQVTSRPRLFESAPGQQRSVAATRVENPLVAVDRVLQAHAGFHAKPKSRNRVRTLTVSGRTGWTVRVFAGCQRLSYLLSGQRRGHLCAGYFG